jgi:hypothetical protein
VIGFDVVKVANCVQGVAFKYLNQPS